MLIHKTLPIYILIDHVNRDYMFHLQVLVRALQGSSPKVLWKKVIPNGILITLTISVTKKRVGNELLTNITKCVMFFAVHSDAFGPTK